MEESEVEEVSENIDLEKLIEERRKEKRKVLREKLQNKLKTIRDRRISDANSEPFPEGAFERVHSNHIWEIVLEYLTDPNDVTNAYFACTLFAEILEERRTLIILPKVLNVFKQKVDDAYEIEGVDTGNACYQHWNDICLSVRGVCKAWMEIAQSHSEVTRYNWVLTTDGINLNNPRTKVFTISDEDSVQEAYSINQRLTLTPIQDINVIIGDRIPVRFYRKLMEYLKAYGSCVRYLFFQYDCPENRAAGVYGRLCDMLKCMENLKTLDIFFNSDADTEDDDEILEVEAEDGVQQGSNYYPLPDLASLENFFCSQWEMNESLLSQILSKHVHLKYVDLWYSSAPAQLETIEALMRLTLERFAGLPTIIISNHFTWPLKYLEIKSLVDMNASELFPAINRFRNTLESLHIWKSVILDDDATNISLELQHLKSFFIWVIGRGTLGLDDLLPLVSLEKISVRFVEYENENSKVKVKLYMESGALQSSNVWQWFPNLKRFEVDSEFRPSVTFCRPTPL